MSWLQLRLAAAQEHMTALESALEDAGALAVTLEDDGDEPVLEPAPGQTPLWGALRVTGLFRADSDLTALLEQLRSLPGGDGARVEILEDKDWEREWMQHYRPMQFAQRLWICPSWQTPPDPAAITLLLDPGLAFGTGTHPTTALCLTALAELVTEGSSVVDFGCGSGILAIAAARLGATDVLAIDNDPQALRATRDNAERNAVPANALSVCAAKVYPRNSWSGRGDIVVANILAGPLAELADELYDLLAPGGHLLLAGLLDSQMDALSQRYAPRLQLSERARRDEWVCLEGTRPH